MAKNPPADVLRKAREVKEGYCLLCGCTYATPCSFTGGSACAWVAGSRRRLCTAHTPREILDATRALRIADGEARV